MDALIIDPELQELIPPPGKEEINRLEESLIRDGCMDTLKAWQDKDRHILLDGHNRFNLCRKLDIPYRVEVVESVTSRYEAIQWMIDLQLARRNLTSERQSYLRGRRYNEEKREVGGQAGNSNAEKRMGHDVTFVSTAARIAQSYGVTGRTIKRDAMYATAIDALSQPERHEILAGKSCRTKAEIVREYRDRNGAPCNPAPVPVQTDYQILLGKALSVIDDLLSTYNRDIRLEILQSALQHLHQTDSVTPQEIQQLFRIVQGGPIHD